MDKKILSTPEAKGKAMLWLKRRGYQPQLPLRRVYIQKANGKMWSLGIPTMKDQEKTRITHIEEGFDFLGQNIRKYGGKLLIKPAKKNVKAFLTNREGTQDGETGRHDQDAQPRYQGMGGLSPAHRRQ